MRSICRQPLTVHAHFLRQHPLFCSLCRYKTVKDKATADQKEGILSALGQAKPMQIRMMNKDNCHGLVREGLKVMVSSRAAGLFVYSGQYQQMSIVSS